MWTVSVLLEAERYRPSILKANEQMLTHLREQEHSALLSLKNRLLFISCRGFLFFFFFLPLDSSPKLKELLSLWDGEDTDDCALRERGEHKLKAGLSGTERNRGRHLNFNATHVGVGLYKIASSHCFLKNKSSSACLLISFFL